MSLAKSQVQIPKYTMPVRCTFQNQTQPNINKSIDECSMVTDDWVIRILKHKINTTYPTLTLSAKMFLKQ